MRAICHHRLATAEDRYEIEVWADEPTAPSLGDQWVVVLYTSESQGDTHYVELTPAEARALAALLVASADRQEKAAKP